MATRNFNKFLLLMWKNWLLQWRHPFQTVMEILAPVLFSALLVLIRSLVDPTPVNNYTYFQPFEITKNITPLYSKMPMFNNVSNKFKPKYMIAYSPANILTLSVIFKLRRSLKFMPVPFKNSQELENFLSKDEQKVSTLCGIQFDDDLINETIFPKNINISLRFPGESRYKISTLVPLNWRTNLLFPLYQMAGPRHPNDTTGGYPAGYYEEKFISVQHYLSKAISESILREIIPEVQLQRFPYPPYIDDPLLIALSNFISIVIMLSFVYTCINTVKVITNEKEKQIKEVMKIMGLPNWLHWLAWFVKTFMFVLISVILIVILLKVQWLPTVSVFTKSNGWVIFLFLSIYMCTTITFCFMISAFFSRANTAATIAGLFWFVSYTPYLFLQPKYDLLSLSEKMIMCLGSNTAMAFGFQFMLMFEGTGEGLQWDTLWKPVTPDDTFVLGYVMIMLLVDAIIYFMVTLYVEAILPGEYGVPQPWYFPFTTQYWCGTPRFSGVEDIAVTQNGNVQQLGSDVYETEPQLYAGIQIKHLRKEFKNKKVAVRGLCLNMYEDQITALLGHNGAGKTTTMSMLTGIYPPTSGTAVVVGNDIWSNMSRVRASLGLCPQHNVLFDDLTVKEHLYFFGKLKGLNKNEIKADSKKYIQLLDLVPKTNSRAGTLSGGMKRKLSVGIALCGNSKVVMLDEPTAGMDPAARRAMWDLLQLEKKGRTMLLTTHFMDEADLLGDRIAIMAGGALQCVGSSFFLKKKYGAGYHLTLEKSPQCNVIKITELLRHYIPNIQVDTNVGSELTYRLAEDKLSVFEEMLSKLENNAKDLGILNYGISLTTLEEVFMNVGADHGQEEEQNAIELNGKDAVMTINGTHNDFEFNRHSSESRLDLGDNLLTGAALYRNQFKAMMMKKWYSSIRSWILSLIQLILPMVFLILAIIVVRSMKANHDLPPLEITLDKYNDPITVVEGNTDLAEAYSSYVSKTLGHQISKTRNDETMEDLILRETEENVPVVRMRYIVGASFDEKIITGWFNNEPYHSLPLSLNLIHNAILYNRTGHNILITNQPMPFMLSTKMKQLAEGNSIGFQIAFNIGFSMTFVSSFYILFCVRERVTKAKHLQFVSGVNVFTFWFSSYLFDFIHFAILSVFLIITLACFQEDGFRTAAELGRIFSVLIMFGLSMLPLIYLTSFCFNIPASGYTKMTFFSIFIGVAGFLVVQILKTPQLELTHIADILDWIFMLVPHYSVSTAINHLYNVYALGQMCETVKAIACDKIPICCNYEANYYGWEDPGIGRNMIFFAAVSITLFGLLIVMEYRIPEKIIYKLNRKNVQAPPDNPEEDDDVANEKHKVENMPEAEIKTHSLLLKNFSKTYGKFLAVNKLSVGVKRSECFGLLGINGAGKTSTFKMLTGDEKISYGDAWINGISLKKHMKEVHRIIGYCPQFDALLDNLTGRETLILFCLLRGVSHKESKFLAEKLATEFDFRRHIDKKVKEYSGGNKRKLSTAVSLIGDPSVVYLDEPSTGMDPAAKRHLWNGLIKVRDSGKCIVLTSHSMEECEALCTRLAIMVNGNFKCLGSTQHLKSKFSEGYTLTVKVKKLNTTTEIAQSEIDPINSYIRQNFPSAILREKYQELLTYYIAEKNIPWSKMFGLMEKGKNFLNIEDYSLGQSSLEQVFLSFTKHQREEV